MNNPLDLVARVMDATFQSAEMRNIFYSADSDDKGARVSTNLPNTICPRCKVTVQPNVEHLCGNRASKAAKKRKAAK